MTKTHMSINVLGAGRAAVIAGLVIAWLAVSAPVASASASTKVYGGTASAGGKVAMDVELAKDGAPKKVTELRAVGLPGTCEISGPDVPLNATEPVNLKIADDGTFGFKVTDDYGNKSSVDGRFSASGKKVTGTFIYASHFQAEGPYPEENCTTGRARFKAKKGGPNAIEPPPQPPARVR